MDLTAHFTANFSSFTDACAKAEVALKGIQDGADQVDTRMKRMADSLSGVKIVQQASIMAEAVERVGGVSKLTAQELQRVGATAAEAAEKLRILGQDVPPGIQKIADAAKAAQGELEKTAKTGTASFEGLLGSVKNLAGALGLAFSAGAIISGAKQLISHAIDMASAIDDASKKLGVSAEKLQGWNAAAALAGGTAEDISSAVAKMNVQLDTGSKTTVDALKAIGLEFHAIRNMKPEDAFEAIATAIMQIPDPMTQSRVATELFGKGSGPILAAIKDDLVKVGAAADKMSNDVVAAGDAAGDALTKLDEHITRRTATTLGELALTLDELGQGTEGLKRIAAALAASGGQQDAYVAALARLRAEHAALSVQEQQQVKDLLAQGKTATEIAALYRSSVTPTILAFAAAQQHASAGTHQSAEELAAQEAALKKAAAAAEAHAKAVSDLADKMSGKKIAENLRDITEALALLSTQGKGLTWPEFIALGKVLETARANGVAFAGQLEEIYIAFIQVNSPIAPLNVSLSTMLKSFGDLGGGLKETEKDTEAFSKGVESLSKELQKMGEPFTTLLREMPTYRGSLDSVAVAAAAVANAHRQLNPELIKSVQLWMSTGLSVDDAIKKIREHTYVSEADADAIRAQGARLTDLSEALRNAGQMFTQLAQIGGGAFGPITKAIGEVTVAFGALQKAAEEVIKKGLNPATFTATAAAAAGLFTVLVSIGQQMANDANEAAALTNHVRDLQAASADFGPVADATGTALRRNLDLLQQWAAAQGDAGTAMKILTSGLSDALIRAQAEALSLSQIINDMGGVTAVTLPNIEARIDTLFQLIAGGGPPARAAIGQLNDVLKQMGDYFAANGGLWDAAFQTAIAKSKELGANLSAINDLMKGQQSNLEQAIGGVTGKLGGEAKTMLDLKKTVTEAQKAYDDLVASGASQDEITKAATELAHAQAAVGHATVTTQAEFDRLNRIALATFNTLVASGKSPIEAMKAIGGSIDDLLAGAQAFGLGSTEAFDTLSRWRDLTKTNEPLLNQISSLNDLMVASANLGGLTASSFADMQTQGVAAYDQLRAAGFTQQEAELAEKPLLESIIKLHKDKGLAIDDATQKLIDQATQDGILGAQEESTQDVLKEGLGALITVLGGDLPEAWRKSADAGTDAAAKITGKDGLDQVNKKLADQQTALKNKEAWNQFQTNATTASGEVTRQIGSIPTTVRVNVAYSASGSTDAPTKSGGGPGGPAANPASRGGLVTATGIEYLQAGGPVWTPQGSDTVPAMLTPGERVLSVAEARRYRGGGGGGTVIVMLDGRVLAQAIVPEFEGAVRRLGFAR